MPVWAWETFQKPQEHLKVLQILSTYQTSDRRAAPSTEETDLKSEGRFRKNSSLILDGSCPGKQTRLLPSEPVWLRDLGDWNGKSNQVKTRKLKPNTWELWVAVTVSYRRSLVWAPSPGCWCRLVGRRLRRRLRVRGGALLSARLADAWMPWEVFYIFHSVPVIEYFNICDTTLKFLQLTECYTFLSLKM